MAEWVLLPENRASWVAVVRFTSEPAELVLFVHGPPGTGKTHLAEVAMSRFLQSQPAAIALHLAATDLGRNLQLPPAERMPHLAEVKQADLLILEDVQHWPRASSHDLAALLDYRQRKRRRTLVTSNVGPAQLDLPTRLTGRFTSGLVVGISPLSHESRLQLAQSFCTERRLQVSPEVVSWLAQAPGGARPMLGEISRLETLAKLYAPPLTLAIVQDNLGTPVSEPGTPMERLAGRVAQRWRVGLGVLKGKSRLANVVRARQVVMYVARQSGQTLTEIGRYLGRDHTTVLHGCEKIASLLPADPVLAAQIGELLTEQGASSSCG